MTGGGSREPDLWLSSGCPFPDEPPAFTQGMIDDRKVATLHYMRWVDHWQAEGWEINSLTLQLTRTGSWDDIAPINEKLTRR